jgi:predicted LPLAT superfamily acyltransferase
MAIKPPVSAEAPRNPGPSWGYGFLLWAERWWPRWFFRPLLMAGTWIAVAAMPLQRGHSRAYLEVVFGRPARLVEVWRHFFALTEVLMLKLRAGRGVPVECTVDESHAAEFWSLVRSDVPALFGTFHFGGSDLLGYLLGEQGRRVSILRQRVGNSEDTRLLGQRFGDHVSFLWTNEPAGMPFALKSAIESGASIAMKCDRPDFSSKLEPFQFLGGPRMFPFTIYHLALLFGLPVVFCIALPSMRDDRLQVFASPVFTPDASLGRFGGLTAARRHFQAVLAQLEQLVHAHPLYWFNFRPLNPLVASQGTPVHSSSEL